MTSTLLKTPPLNAPKIKTLPNGLTIVAEEMPVDAVNLNVWMNVGSAVEADEINGMAHFLEHMVFKGTPRIKSGEFEKLIEERGAVTNAATSHDYTHYYITTAPKDFAQLAPLQLDVVINPTIPDDAFERERLVVLEEIRRSEDNPSRRTFRRAMETAFTRLPYRRQVLGPTSVIEQVKPQQMRDFHAQWYQPSSTVAVAVGNLPVDRLIEIVAEGFTEAESHKSKFTSHNSNIKIHPESPFTEIVRQEYVDQTLQQARLVMVWRVPGMTDLKRTYALDVLAGILGHGRMSRLVRDLREERQLVNHIGVSNMTQQLQGIFYISAQLDTENIPVVEAAIVEHIQKLQNELVTEADIARIRTQVANRFVFGNEKPSDRTGLYGYYYSQLGDLAPALNYPTSIQAVDSLEIQLAAQEYLATDAYGIVTVKPA
ncbi:MAG TPA: peptidase M16 [Cyanobacteria bacterium UBA11149]|nr:peptidase M16 [Cyanobacteria bacterium UBA11367]HBE57174.1 peptidase M16 [Cyanobacteria bacterium UBA11366]HBK66183.1 peptidase M16 [Cyanobacteria bacterium UBA11166]HBR73668.1 peptidase M16 [Cyanobacteria bacterium UBA11159]HBS71461.1 peptidase M16 [Cyanobacteria bacterium UBA11153]HBW89155.1 peptidase M16 [Cyanobacteria bacterium UBA11149]HCA94708.1 peptidase M16 [Cyanobacteria bacterium UBA9226]